MQETPSQTLQSLIHTLQKPVEDKQTVPTTQLVIFKIDEQKYCVEITDLKEIIVGGELTPLPNSPEYVKGIFNLRGRIVAVIDLMKKIKLQGYIESKKRREILISEVDNDLYGIEIDEVIAIQTVEEKAIKPAPEVILKKIHGEQSIKGVVMLDSKNETDDASNTEPEIIIMFSLRQLLTNN